MLKTAEQKMPRRKNCHEGKRSKRIIDEGSTLRRSARARRVAVRGERRATLGNHPQRLRVEVVFRFKDPRGKRFLGIALQNGNGLLCDDRSRIGFLDDEMNSGAVPIDARFERAAVGVQPLKLRQ